MAGSFAKQTIQLSPVHAPTYNKQGATAPDHGKSVVVRVFQQPGWGQVLLSRFGAAPVQLVEVEAPVLEIAHRTAAPDLVELVEIEVRDQGHLGIWCGLGGNGIVWERIIGRGEYR